MLDFRMETFLAVCKYMNFTRAAKALNITQPAVSMHIKYIEDLYGIALFERNHKKLTLTPAGKLLKNSLETMRNDENRISQRMKESIVGKKVIRFGVTMTIGEYAIIPSLISFTKQHPQTDFYIRYGNTETLLNDLAEGTIDFAIVEGFFRHDEYESLVFKQDDYIAVCALNHIFSQPIHQLKDLVHERLITRELGSGTRAILMQSLNLLNVSTSDFASLIEVENIHTIVKLVEADCGIAFLYKSAVRDELERGRIKEIQLDDFKVSHDFTFIWNKNSVFSKEYIAYYYALLKP